jgi:hypothetical protein
MCLLEERVLIIGLQVQALGHECISAGGADGVWVALQLTADTF